MVTKKFLIAKFDCIYYFKCLHYIFMYSIFGKNVGPMALLKALRWFCPLSVNVSFVSVLATVLSEFWKKLEEIFFWNDITLRRLWKLYHFEKKYQAFFNILTEPLLVQKQTIHQQKAWDLSYLEREGQGRGLVRRVPRPFSAKHIEKKK